MRWFTNVANLFTRIVKKLRGRKHAFNVLHLFAKPEGYVIMEGTP
jgi:hypothetical protein